MAITTKIIQRYFEEKGLRYRYNEEHDVITLGFNLDNKPDGIDIKIFGDEDNDEAIHLRSFDYVNIPKGKKQKAYELCSKMNSTYTWVKFYVDESDDTVTLADDAVVQLDSVGAEAYELVMRMVSISDDAYIDFMKGIWV